MDKPLRTHSGYFDRAFGNLDQIAEDMLEKVQDVEFDTLVGTGLSGTLVVPTLARAFGVYWAIVRKESSPHTSVMVEGEIGHKWLFVDDFICSGATLIRVKRAIRGRIDQIGYYWSTAATFQTEYVGTYEYQENNYRSR